ncbi:hypothetical protein Glove_543g90 [Diversispora epigaea]|uniref:Uncharacterized protein n=1 Tax=Diversispora epigaea TaxID=1348612 RepID=A0A397GF20_9GLOM|nr:hypothetical protein Glove_543g90 [Diversispora epigaea]
MPYWIPNLAQLPPVENYPVFKSPIWKPFYPTILREPQKQNLNSTYYKLLEKVRFRNIDQFSWDMLQTIIKYSTHYQINQIICDMLPIQHNEYVISNSIDIINNNEIQDDENIQRWTKQKINLPQKNTITNWSTGYILK